MRSIRVKFNFLLLLVFSSGALFGYKAYLEYRNIEKMQEAVAMSLNLRNKITLLVPGDKDLKPIEDLRKIKSKIDDVLRRNAVSNLIQAYSANNPRLYKLRLEELDTAERRFFRESHRKVRDFKKQFRINIAIAFFFPLIGFAVLTYFFNLKIARPLDKLSKKMMEFLIDQYTFRFSKPDNSEIGNLERTFNALAQKVLNNIDELKALDKAKSEFVSIASHELRTPLTSIKGSLGMLTTGIAGQMDEEATDLVSVADRETDRLVRLINELLDLAKIESRTFSLKKDWEPVESLIESSLESLQGFAKAANVRLVSDIAGPLVDIHIDRDRIQQVITNLVSNAIKYSPEGDAVTVGFQMTHQKNVMITVSDNGPGISKENQGLIFEKFRQATNSSTPLVKGTGLGLAISKALVEEHGGDIGIESELGDGCTFYFILKEWQLPERETVTDSDTEDLSAEQQKVA